MIKTLLNNPHVLYQEFDDDLCVPGEPAISGCTDASGLIVLQQEGAEIIVSRNSVRGLKIMLDKLLRASEPKTKS